MVRSTASVCSSFYAVTVAAICVLQCVNRKVDTIWTSSNCPRNSTPTELRKILIEKNCLDDNGLEYNDSCTFDKAECLGRQSSQVMLLQQFSLLLSEYQRMRYGVTNHQELLVRLQEERINRRRTRRKPSMMEWKLDPGNDVSMPHENPTQLVAHQDMIHRVQNRDNILCRER